MFKIDNFMILFSQYEISYRLLLNITMDGISGCNSIVLFFIYSIYIKSIS